MRELAARVGAGMAQSFDSVASIESTLTKVCAAQGVDDAIVLAFPTAVVVQTGGGEQSGVQVDTNFGGSLRYDQIAALYTYIKVLKSQHVDLGMANQELDNIANLSPRYPWFVRVLGYSLFAAGFSLILQPTLATVITCTLLGLLIGAIYLAKIPTLQLVLPVVVSFLVTAVVLLIAGRFGLEDPVRILVPLLVIFLPGAAITIGVIELASNQMVAGASRLVSGTVTLLLLAFGIFAATALLDVPPEVVQDIPVGTIGPWVMVIAIPIYLVGLMLLFCSPWKYFPWMLVILIVTYLGQLFGSVVFSAQLSGFFGALAMTPLALWFDSLPNGPSKLVTILPAFWMIVPGASGLMAIVGIGADQSRGSLDSVVVTVIAIALGILTGTALFNSLHKVQHYWAARRAGAPAS
ncbi:unannotated protein [freshwater metagenome]|uniref:Unannotated protein n=1 Tax=freshwater metagenome TaxID=449393 RepID=A0A6J7QGT9_9ZZZZ